MNDTSLDLVGVAAGPIIDIHFLRRELEIKAAVDGEPLRHAFPLPSLDHSREWLYISLKNGPASTMLAQYIAHNSMAPHTVS